MKKTLYQQCKTNGINFFIGVPCSGLKAFIEDIQKDQDNIYCPAPREDTAVAIAVGAYFTGKKPLVFMQNSGLGHVVNITTSLLKPYKIPVHFLISVRKTPFEHEYMYKITRKLIKILGWNNNATFIETKND